MSSIRTLTDLELDAVTGGATNTGIGSNTVTAGSGGAGGTINIGAAVERLDDANDNNSSVKNSGGNRANGGRGGDVTNRIRQRFSR